MFHTPAHKQVAAKPAPVKTLADYIAKVQQLESPGRATPVTCHECLPGHRDYLRNVKA